ncbi:MAG: hypothetical protein JNJ73_17725 [Hyphomonadaceae bacterium]|nr:hypothetical protein [Hyphomonadaceae bacterium]
MNFSWQGGSGRWYEFDVAREKAVWGPEGGLYMFVKPGDYPSMEAGGPICLYAAMAESFEHALARHELWQAAHTLGAREVHLLVIEDAVRRERVLKDILNAQTPILNRQPMRRVA